MAKVYTPKGQQTKEHLIRVSAGLFNRQGYAGTAISDILKASGYSKGALYRVFEDKDELAKEAFLFNLEIVKGLLHNAVESAESPLDKIMAIPNYYKTVHTHGFIEGGCPVLNTAVEVDDTDNELNAMVIKAFEGMAKLIEDTLRNYMVKENKNNLDPKAMSLFMVATIEGSVALIKTTRNPHIMKTNMEYLEKMILQML